MHESFDDIRTANLCSTMSLNVSCCNVLRRFGRQIASCEEGGDSVILIFRFKLRLKHYQHCLKSFQHCSENHARILPKSIKNHQKSIRNGVPEGSWAVWGPLPRARRPRDRFWIDFGVHFGIHFGAEIDIKSLKNRFGVCPSAPKNGTRF